MVHDYQTQQSDGLWHCTTIRKSHDFLVMRLCVVSRQNKKRYMFISSSPFDTKLEKVVANDMVLTLKKLHRT